MMNPSKLPLPYMTHDYVHHEVVPSHWKQIMAATCNVKCQGRTCQEGRAACQMKELATALAGIAKRAAKKATHQGIEME
jgi:hypothetical protein